MFVVSYTNLSERTASHTQLEGGGPDEVLVRDASAKPVPLSEKGRRTWVTNSWIVHTEADHIPIEPGFAVAEKVPLDEYFDLSHPGTYTVLGWWAKPVTFVLRKRGNTACETSSLLCVCRPDEPFEKAWKHAIVAAGHPHDDLLLEAVVSPVDRRSVNLVVSLRNVCTSGNIAPGWACPVSEKNAYAFPSLRDTSPGVDAKAGVKASDYRILVKEAPGEVVPLTEVGRKWLAGHELRSLRPLRPGEAIGFVFPFHEMFAIKAGRNYSVLVILRGKAADDPAWIASPVEIKVPANAGDSSG
jgi:hypothetical protein